MRFEATTISIAEDGNRYPFHGKTIDAVRIVATDRVALRTSEMGLEVLTVLRRMYPEQFKWKGAERLVANEETMKAIERGDDPRAIAESWKAGLTGFEAKRAGYLLYR